jgi:hypothetical protein
MSAMLCEVEERGWAAPEIGTEFYTRVGAAPQARHCPDCRSVIYSRRHKLCGVCAAVLPDEILFNAAQAQNVSSFMREERQRHRAWLERFNFAN